MSTLGRQDIELDYNADIPTNNNEEVSAADVRSVLANFNDSKFNLVDDTLENVTYSTTDARDSVTVINELLKLSNEKADVNRKLFNVTVLVDRNTTLSTLNSFTTNFTGLSVTITQSGGGGNFIINFSFPNIVNASNYSIDIGKTPQLNSVTDTNATTDIFSVTNQNSSLGTYNLDFYPLTPNFNEYIIED